MNALLEAARVVDELDEGYDFWGLCQWTAEQPGGYVVIRPDFIGVGQLEGTCMNIWLAVGDDGVRKALELAPAGLTHAAWKRGICDKTQTVRIFPIERIRHFIQ